MSIRIALALIGLVAVAGYIAYSLHHPSTPRKPESSALADAVEREVAERLTQLRERAAFDGYPTVRAELEQTLGAYGIDVLAPSVGALTVAIGNSAIRAELVAALDCTAAALLVESPTDPRLTALLNAAATIGAHGFANDVRRKLAGTSRDATMVASSGLARELPAELLACLLFQLSGRGRYPEGLGLLREAARLRRDDFVLQIALSSALRSARPDPDEEAALTAAAALHPGDARVWHRLANAALAADDARTAVEHARRADREDPQNPAILTTLATALERTGDRDGAAALRREIAESAGAGEKPPLDAFDSGCAAILASADDTLEPGRRTEWFRRGLDSLEAYRDRVAGLHGDERSRAIETWLGHAAMRLIENPSPHHPQAERDRALRLLGDVRKLRR